MGWEMVHFVQFLMAALEMLAVMWRQLQFRGENQKSKKMVRLWFNAKLSCLQASSGLLEFSFFSFGFFCSDFGLDSACRI